MTPGSSPRIAVLLDSIESDYAKQAIAGVCRAARASRTRVLIVAGGHLGQSPNESPTRNFIYELLPRAKVDGLLVLGGALSNVCGIDRFRQWVLGFRPIPCVTIGLRLEGLPGVTADHDLGIRAAIRHLVEVHNRRRIACVRGPSTGPEPDARYLAYQRALADHGIRLNERLVVEPSQFGWDAGNAAVVTLFDKRRFTPHTLDAVVCVNDDVARGVLDALQKRSIAVPDQLAVVGFDNSPRAISANPPLTTVDQRVELQAYTAACQLLETLQGASPTECVVLATEPAIRASCGCLAELKNDSRTTSVAAIGATNPCRIALLEHQSKIAKALLEVAGNRLVNAPGWELRVLDALLRDLTIGYTTHVVHEFESLARRHAAAGGDLSACQEVLTTLRLQVLSNGGAAPETRPMLEDLLQEARLVLGRVGIDVERSRQEVLGRRMANIARQCHALLDRDALIDLASQLDDHLPAIGIKGFVVSRAVEPLDSLTEFEVIARRSQGEWRTPSRTLPAETLGLDATLDQAGIVVVEPLDSGARPLGIAAFTWGADIPEHYEQLRELFSTAIRAIQLRRGPGEPPVS